MSDGNPSKRASDGMVHWRKFSLMDEAVMAIVKCQQHDRPTRPNPAVERLIMDLPVMDEEVRMNLADSFPSTLILLQTHTDLVVLMNDFFPLYRLYTNDL